MQPIELIVERGGRKLDPIKVTPAMNADTDRPMIGLGFDEEEGILFDNYGRGETRRPPVAEQIKLSVGAIVNTIGAVASRKSNIRVQHMGGPVMMMRIYYMLFEQPEGWKLALWFSVLLNVNLALLNMLPLPVLDGGHITLALIEAARRKPVNITSSNGCRPRARCSSSASCSSSPSSTCRISSAAKTATSSATARPQRRRSERVPRASCRAAAILTVHRALNNSNA